MTSQESINALCRYRAELNASGRRFVDAITASSIDRIDYVACVAMAARIVAEQLGMQLGTLEVARREIPDIGDVVADEIASIRQAIEMEIVSIGTNSEAIKEQVRRAAGGGA